MSAEFVKEVCDEKHDHIGERLEKVEKGTERLWRRTDEHEKRISFIEGRQFSGGFWGALIGSGLITIATGLILYAILGK